MFTSDRWPACRMGDVAGGVAGAMVVLPQAMAYGVALFALMDMSAASGALAGLIGAACLSLVSGAFGGTIALISSPTGPSLALLSGSVVALAAYDLSGGRLLAALVAVTVLAGVIQIAVAVSGGGRLIKYLLLGRLNFVVRRIFEIFYILCIKRGNAGGKYGRRYPTAMK